MLSSTMQNISSSLCSTILELLTARSCRIFSKCNKVADKNLTQLNTFYKCILKFRYVIEYDRRPQWYTNRMKYTWVDKMQPISVCHLMYISFCLCITVRSASVFNCLCEFLDTLIKSVELCQVLVSHFVTLTDDSAAPGSQSSRIVVHRLEEIFCIMEESM
jgi:hypothetical protein